MRIVRIFAYRLESNSGYLRRGRAMRSSPPRLDAAKAEAAVPNERAGFPAKSAKGKKQGVSGGSWGVDGRRVRWEGGRGRTSLRILFFSSSPKSAEKEDGKDKANSRETPGLT